MSKKHPTGFSKPLKVVPRQEQKESVWISWNDTPPVEYQFKTAAEMNAFLAGIDAAVNAVEHHSVPFPSI